MTSIVFKIVRIYSNQFKCKYLKNNKSFLIFSSISEIYIKFWIFLKKGDPHSLCISEITDCKRRG